MSPLVAAPVDHVWIILCRSGPSFRVVAIRPAMEDAMKTIGLLTERYPDRAYYLAKVVSRSERKIEVMDTAKEYTKCPKCGSNDIDAERIDPEYLYRNIHCHTCLYRWQEFFKFTESSFPEEE